MSDFNSDFSGDKVVELLNSIVNLDIEVRTVHDKYTSDESKIQFRIKEIISNGYVCLLRNKKRGGLKVPQTKKWTIPYCSFVNNEPPYGLSRNYGFMLDVSGLTPNEWYDFPYKSTLLMDIKDTPLQKQYYFTGNVYPNPIDYTNMANFKRTTRLKLALQYIQFDENFLSGKKVNGNYPPMTVKEGNMIKLNAYLRAKSTNFNDRVYLYINID